MMRTFALLFSYLMVSNEVVAQPGGLTGILLDEKRSPIAFANVSLLSWSDSVFVAGTLTNAEGKFTIQSPQPGRYFLRFTSIGFAENKTGAFEVDKQPFSKDFGSLSLLTDKKILKEVTVTSIRPTISQLADRMVVNIQGTALAAGNNAYEVLARAPGVFIDQEGNIQLNGKSGVTIMLDGKLTYLSARDLRTLLESMSAENIRNIEIITNPSAKYDAEGASGILNINLKKNDQQGMNGSLYSSYAYNFKQHIYSAGGNINHKKDKWNSFVNLDFSRRAGGREATFTRIFYAGQKTTYFDQVATGNYSVIGPPSVRLGTDYSFNKSQSAGFMVSYTNNTLKQDFLTETYIGSVAKQPELFIDADNFGSNHLENFTSNIHYSWKPDTSGSLISADVDYVKIRNKGDSYFNNFYDTIAGATPVTADYLYTDLPNGYDIYSGKIDLTRAFNKGRKLEVGVKASRVISDNDSRFYFDNGPRVPDPLRTNHFNYRENIYAGYVNVNGNISKKITVQAGLRLEQTRSLGNSLTTAQITSRKYTNLFPSLFIQQKVNDNYGINYSYSRRVQRPNYGNLNPFIVYRDPYTWFTGNPYLRPQYTHSFSITQTIRKNYNLTLSYQLIQDVFAELLELDVEKATTTYYIGNVNDGNNVSLTAIAPLRITKKWDSQNTLVVAYNKFSLASNSGQLINDQVFYMLQSNHTIQLPKEIKVELNLLYRGPAASGLYLLAPMHRVDVGIKKSILKKKIDLTVSGNDLFKGLRYRFTTDINGNVNDFDQYFRFRNVGVTIRYNFSSGQKVDTKRRTNSLEELNRTGS